MNDHKLQIILSARDATKKTFKSVTGRVKALTGSVFSLQGAIATLGGATMLGLVGRSILATGAEYEQTMSKVKAITKAGQQDFKELSNLAKDFGERTEFTATQVGQLEIAYAKLGLTKNEILEVTGLTLDLATALDADLSEAATVAAGTLNSFNAQARELPRYMDVMAASTTTTALDMEKFQGAMSNVGAAARAYGWDIEQTTAKVGALVDANIEATKAGTDVRKIITELAKTGMTYDEALDKILNSTNKVKTAQKLFGQRAFVSAIILAEQRDKVKDLTKQYYNATGSLKEMAGVMRDNVITRWYEFKSAIERVEIDTFEQDAGILNETLKDMAQYVRENREEFVRLANEGVGAVYGSLKSLKGLYDSMPAGVVGAAGYGIVGRIIFGGWGPAKVVGAIYLVNEGLKEFNADLGNAVKNWKEWDTAVGNIADVISGKRDWNTGAQKPREFEVPRGPATYYGAIGPETKGWDIYQPPRTDFGGAGGGGAAVDTSGADASKKEYERLMKEVEKARTEFEKSLIIPSGTGEIMEQQLRIDIGQYVTGFDSTAEDIEKTKQAFEEMYSDLRFQSEGYYDYRRSVLEQQAADYEKFTGDEVLAHQWLCEQIKALDQERLDATKKNNVFLVELSERTGDAIEDNFSKFYRDVFRGELDSAADYFRAFCNSLSDSFSDMLGQMTKELLFGGGSSGGGGLLKSLFSGIGGMFGGGTSMDANAGLGADWAGTLWHKGGTVGKDSAPTRHVPASVFAHAPRLHEGYPKLSPDEFPAILKYDETVLPPGVKPVNNMQNVKNTTISVPVNIDSVADRRLSARLQDEIERKVRDVMREEMR